MESKDSQEKIRAGDKGAGAGQVLQPLMFPKKNICTEKLLYFREKGNVRFDWDNGSFRLAEGAVVSFDVYFNFFSATKWCRYTGVRRLGLQLALEGTFDICLLRLGVSDQKLNEKMIDAIHVEKAEPEQPVECSFGEISAPGMYAFRLIACGKGGRFLGGAYTSEEHLPERETSAAIVFCTYRREKYLLQNIERFRQYRKALRVQSSLENIGCEGKNIAQNANDSECGFESECVSKGQTERASGENPESKGGYARWEGMPDKEFPVEIFVSDNAKTLDAEALSNDWIHVFPNRNAGGAGGYARGMLEILRCQKDKRFTHCILMDDDVTIDPAVVERTLRLLRYVKEEYRLNPVGGAMLRDDLPYIQHEYGGKAYENFVGPIHPGYDLRKRKQCVKNENFIGADYNAWWYCVIPMEHVREDNLPMPMFVRYDDVEYGIRIGRSPLLLNGICVWHENFQNKYAVSMLYYDNRNRLIMDAVRGRHFSVDEVIKELKLVVFVETILYRYKAAKSILRGVQDFLKGPEWLMQQDPEELHKSVSADGYKLTDAFRQEVPFDENWYRVCCKIKDVDKLHGFVRKATMNGMYLKANRTVIVPIYGAGIAALYRVTKALNYNENTGLGFVTEKSMDEYRACKKELRETVRMLKRDYTRVKEAYREKCNVFSSAEFWKGYLNRRKKKWK